MISLSDIKTEDDIKDFCEQMLKQWDKILQSRPPYPIFMTFEGRFFPTVGDLIKYIRSLNAPFDHTPNIADVRITEVKK